METKYVITDGVNYLELKNGSVPNILTKVKENAHTWSKEKSAENILSMYKVAKAKSKPWKLNRERFFKVEMVEIFDNETIINTKNNELDFNLQEEIALLCDKIPQLEKRKKFLEDKISYYDRKTQDILHCAENYKLDIQKGYKLYKSLHDTRIERRVIKNEHESISYMLATLGKNFDTKGIISVQNFVEDKYNCTKYNPRVVDELFDLLQ